MESLLSSVMTSHGYLALVIFAFIEAACIPISSEVTFGLAGLFASQGKFSLAGVIIIGTLAEVIGATLAYAVGRRGGRYLLERYGRWVLVTHSDLDRAERFFSGRGSWAVAVGRILPVVRTFAGFAAGVVEVPAAPFSIYNVIGTLVYVIGLSTFGYVLGPTVTKFFNSFSVVGIVLVVLFIAALIAHRVHALRKDSAARAAGEYASQPRPAGRSGGAHRNSRGSVD